VEDGNPSSLIPATKVVDKQPTSGSSIVLETNESLSQK
jgi:hypothetical protein